MTSTSTEHERPAVSDASAATAVARQSPRSHVDEPATIPIDVDRVIRELERSGDPGRFLNPQVVDVRHNHPDVVLLAPCPVCDGHLGRPAFEIPGLAHRLLICEECGLGRLHPLPTPEELPQFYPAAYYGSPGAKFEPLTEAVVRWVGSLHVRSLSRRLQPGSRILDVGCGRGVLLGALADRGHQVHGMDVSETAVDGADPRAEIRVAPCLTQAGYASGDFDQVILWHVLEHLTNPREVLAEVHRILKPGGQVIVAVPNFSSLQARWAGAAWFHLDLPRHLFHFPVAGLRRLLQRTQFSVIQEQHFSLRQNPFGWVQSGLNKWNGQSRNALYSLLHNGGGHRTESSGWNERCLRAAYLTAMPFATGLSLTAAALGRGATVCLVGRAE
jgi:methionine biosynthesis protein MetW